MPDITKCRGENCPLKESCYRYTSKDSFRQSYFFFFFYGVDLANHCKYYWNMSDEEPS